ncbi:LL-diaminopimelate aminotransferase [Desulfomicrobium orale]|uniref:Aminotransferase n=1 Tax=Desulfomicrobium orale DSM 12838 TaxID=888061 RepID=A0A0X8JR20_9BACT|nr:LL-diaminopimelate aminotransferase [Desulfomicrobium orale]AMD93340.1 LL-diaminopimelate aminotransferase [Desulfomicrobium orale DSM 12838]
MIRVNENYLKLKASYLFSDIARRVADFQKENPDRKIIRMGIGDVTEPLSPAVIRAFHEGVDEMASASTFHGYGPEQGYGFLRELIAREDFQSRGADIAPDEIFISDGAKCDTGNIQELFAGDIRVAVPDPVYPVYVDTNVMAGRTGNNAGGRYESLVYLEGTRANGFIPDLPKEPVDLIYLCYPNNPTGATITREQLGKWVDYARKHKALILYDAAYESFIRDPSLPRTIYEIEGAREVAIEFRSLSKTAGFTGTRLAFVAVPKTCVAYDSAGNGHSLHALWNRRQSTKTNGVSYPVQKAAAAVYSPEGRAQTAALVDHYLSNAAIIRREMTSLGYDCVGGENSPYVWIDGKMGSWEFFDMLLREAAVVCTPGAGFGACGEGFIRISAFNSLENVQEAMERLRSVLK